MTEKVFNAEGEGKDLPCQFAVTVRRIRRRPRSSTAFSVVTREREVEQEVHSRGGGGGGLCPRASLPGGNYIHCRGVQLPGAGRCCEAVEAFRPEERVLIEARGRKSNSPGWAWITDPGEAARL